MRPRNPLTALFTAGLAADMYGNDQVTDRPAQAREWMQEVTVDPELWRQRAGANGEMDIYGGARHGFTNPDVGDYGIDNLRYDAQADARSWQRMQDFFRELFAE
ncbi:MAG: dienelactone hydrolase family protein [Halochromatium sp.]|uniref:dienelactone hydrolase family protein n=1 Tax=Halochromatium sp. TaxID=2049430 RepID=UPI00397C88D6